MKGRERRRKINRLAAITIDLSNLMMHVFTPIYGRVSEDCSIITHHFDIDGLRVLSNKKLKYLYKGIPTGIKAI